jgi:hypothetical protein
MQMTVVEAEELVLPAVAGCVVVELHQGIHDMLVSGSLGFDSGQGAF